VIRRAHASITLDVPQAEIYGLLTEYEGFADWVPGITGCRVLASEGDITVVELVTGERSLTLELIASPPRGLQFATVDEPRRRTVSGGWRIHEDSSGNGTVLEARLRMHTRLFDFRARRRMRDALETALASVRQQVARVTRQVPPTGVLRRKILEVIRHEDGIQVWIEGNTYELRRTIEEADP
jgi:hypothetical protein